jgi:dUTP pyrophosphatase
LLKIKRLNPDAILPTAANPSDDLGYDLYASEGMDLEPFKPTLVKTGIAIEFVPKAGVLIRDRSSVASKQNVFVTAGVIDAGYRGELMVLMTCLNFPLLAVEINPVRIRVEHRGVTIKKGQKIAQMIPIVPLTHQEVFDVEELSESSRGTNGFGSSGK